MKSKTKNITIHPIDKLCSCIIFRKELESQLSYLLNSEKVIQDYSNVSESKYWLYKETQYLDNEVLTNLTQCEGIGHAYSLMSNDLSATRKRSRRTIISTNWKIGGAFVIKIIRFIDLVNTDYVNNPLVNTFETEIALNSDEHIEKIDDLIKNVIQNDQ